MDAFFFLLNDHDHGGHYHHQHYPTAGPTGAGDDGGRGGHSDLSDILNPLNNFSPFLDDQLGNDQSYYGPLIYPSEADAGAIVVDHWAPEPYNNSKAYVPDQYRADFMSERDDWSILERRRQQRNQRIAAYQARARAVVRRIVGYVRLTKDEQAARTSGRHARSGERKQRSLQWYDGSKDVDVTGSDRQRSLRARRLRKHRRRQDRHRRYRQHLIDSFSESSVENDISIEARAKAVGLKKPAYHRRWYRAPRYGAYNPYSPSTRAVHQYASLASPVLASPFVLAGGIGFGDYGQPAAARRQLKAIYDTETRLRKQEQEMSPRKKNREENRIEEKKRYHRLDKGPTGMNMLAAMASDGNNSILTSTDSKLSKSSVKPLCNTASFEGSRTSHNNDNPANATHNTENDSPESLGAGGDDSQGSKEPSVSSKAASSGLNQKVSAQMLPCGLSKTPDSKVAVNPDLSRRPCGTWQLHSFSSRQSYQSYGTNRTRRSAPHRALHRGLRHTRRFLRFINNTLGKVIWRYYYRWVYPYWDVWQERKQQERSEREEKKTIAHFQNQSQPTDPSCRRSFFADELSCLRSWILSWVCGRPRPSNRELCESNKNDCPPGDTLDALEAQCDPADFDKSACEQHQSQRQACSPPETGSCAEPATNIDEQKPIDRELRRVEPIAISSDVDIDSDHDNAADSKASRRKAKLKGSESTNNTWTKGCILCGLERLGASIGEGVKM